MEIQPYKPPPEYERPEWGVIILTGIVSIMVIAGSVLLYQQVGDAWDRMKQGFATPSLPALQPTQLPAAFALRVPAQGRWQASITVTAPDGTIHVYTRSGEGHSEIAFPQIARPEGATIRETLRFEITISYPSYLELNRIDTKILKFDDVGRYQVALENQYFAIYGNDLQLRTITASESEVNDLSVADWTPGQPLPPIRGDFGESE